MSNPSEGVQNPSGKGSRSKQCFYSTSGTLLAAPVLTHTGGSRSGDRCSMTVLRGKVAHSDSLRIHRVVTLDIAPPVLEV